MIEKLSYYLLLVLPSFFFFIIFKHYSSSPFNLPPSPPALPLIGHFHLIKKSLYLSLASISSRYGPVFLLRLGCKSFVVVSSPSAVAECFTKNDIIFANRPKSMAADRVTFDYASFVMLPYGDSWRNLRRLSVVELLSTHRLQKSAEIRQKEILKIARLLCRNEGQKVDLNNLILTYGFNIMMIALIGKPCVVEDEIGSEVGKETLKQWLTTFAPALGIGVCDYFPVLRWIGYKGLEKKLISLHNKRDVLLQSWIDEVREKKDLSDVKRKPNLLGTLLSLQESEPEFYTDRVIKSIILAIIIAGIDTSALTIEWAMSRLLCEQEELRKVIKEIDENVGHDHLLNESDIVKLPYLGCVVNETLRLHPPAPTLVAHYSSQDCVVSGYNIPKGTILWVNAWAIHRDPTLWDKPDKFIPQRFQGVNMEREGPKFVPFGIGRRACPGAAMAMRTICLALGVFLQCFEWQKPLDMEMDFTLYEPKHLKAVCFPRNKATHLLSPL